MSHQTVITITVKEKIINTDVTSHNGSNGTSTDRTYIIIDNNGESFECLHNYAIFENKEIKMYSELQKDSTNKVSVGGMNFLGSRRTIFSIIK